MNLANMRQAVSYWSSIPSSQWDMDRFWHEGKGCALGLLAHAGVCGLTTCNAEGLPCLRRAYETFLGIEAGALALGITNWQAVDLFRMKTSCERESGLSDKAIFFARLNELLQFKGMSMAQLMAEEPHHVEDVVHG